MSPLSGYWEAWSRCLFPLELVQIKGLHGEEEQRTVDILNTVSEWSHNGGQGIPYLDLYWPWKPEQAFTDSASSARRMI